MTVPREIFIQIAHKNLQPSSHEYTHRTAKHHEQIVSSVKWTSSYEAAYDV
jgi:hypothetical protein